MVLDLRLMKIGCRETANFFCPLFKLSRAPIFMYPLSLGYSPNKFASALGYRKRSSQCTFSRLGIVRTLFASALGYRKRSSQCTFSRLGIVRTLFASALGYRKRSSQCTFSRLGIVRTLFASALGYRKRSAPVVIRKFLKKSYITYCQ